MPYGLFVYVFLATVSRTKISPSEIPEMSCRPVICMCISHTIRRQLWYLILTISTFIKSSYNEFKLIQKICNCTLENLYCGLVGYKPIHIIRRELTLSSSEWKCRTTWSFTYYTAECPTASRPPRSVIDEKSRLKIGADHLRSIEYSRNCVVFYSKIGNA